MSATHDIASVLGSRLQDDTESVRSSPKVDMPQINLMRLLPILACCVAGLWLQTLANDSSRAGSGSVPEDLFFWAGLLLIFVPVTIRLLATRLHRIERLWLIVSLGMALYLVKVLSSPEAFTAFDEFIHVRSTQDILDTDRLFAPNPLLPTASYYPGLPALTAGLVALTGLSVFACGLIVIGVARAIISFALFLVAERITGSARAASVASLLYAANPMFLFWSSPFAYEHLALPLAAYVIWWVGTTRVRTSAICILLAVLGVVAVTVTHHVVGFALAALLSAWWIAELMSSDPSKPARRQVGALALLASIATPVWFFAVARPAADYLLAGNMYPALRELGFLLSGKSPPRELYKSGGFAPPWWEPVAGFAAVGIVVLALIPALLVAWNWRHRAAVVVAALFAAAFPLSLIPRLTTFGVAVSGRTSEYLYAAVGCVIGLLFASMPVSSSAQRGAVRQFTLRAREWWTGQQGAVWVTVVSLILLTVVFVGNVVVGKPFYQRLPEGPVVQGYEWSVQPDVIAAAQWARDNLGANQKFGANAIDALALGTYGMQDVVDRTQIWHIFFAENMNRDVHDDIRKYQLEFILINWRMTHGVPLTPGFYFDAYEPGAGEYTHAFPIRALEKFMTDPCVQSVYASGAVQIVDVTKIEDGTCL
ncbi:hypothetical protein [Mycolicibacterium arenosum]|uniref:Glycosyltransferase RgtA/B/C/D-like domain-containing protein n=1 Tax=Mycolicibacterium arenosum TaxID=2952157 RepID=A0ABT1M8T6_9MYCO|nr:hypothetical protein [Mycolicibacterium sp. CAU 1645]MCP9275285.1 hypothetical protein [Mycolicibacterium sp. CAU 1645]